MLEQLTIEQDILQVIGMVLLTILIPIAIAILNEKKDFDNLDRNVILDHNLALPLRKATEGRSPKLRVGENKKPIAGQFLFYRPRVCRKPNLFWFCGFSLGVTIWLPKY